MCELVNYYVFDAAALVLAQVLTGNKSCDCFVPYWHNQRCALRLGCADSKELRIYITFQNTMKATCCPVCKNIWHAALLSLAKVLASLGTSGQSPNSVYTYTLLNGAEKQAFRGFRLDGFLHAQSSEQNKLVRTAYVHQSTGNVLLHYMYRRSL